jgi:hypothetical protein
VADETKEAESGGLEKLLLDLADKAAGKAEDSKGSSLPIYVIFAGLAVVCFAILGFLAVRAKRKAAQLEYELRLKVEEQKRAVEQVLLEQDVAKRNEAAGKAQELVVDVERLKKEVAANEAAAAARTKALAQATSWNDLVIIDKRK